MEIAKFISNLLTEKEEATSDDKRNWVSDTTWETCIVIAGS